MPRKMNDNRYAAPGSPVSDIEAEAPTRPRSVIYGVCLLWLSAACVLPTVAFELTERPVNLTPQQSIIENLVTLAIAGGIAWIFNTATWRGRNWGRWVNTILVTLGVIGTSFMLYVMRYGPPYLRDYQLPGYLLVQYIIQGIVSLIALSFLFTPSANTWFRQMKRLR